MYNLNELSCIEILQKAKDDVETVLKKNCIKNNNVLSCISGSLFRAIHYEPADSRLWIVCADKDERVLFSDLSLNEIQHLVYSIEPFVECREPSRESVFGDRKSVV